LIVQKIANHSGKAVMLREQMSNPLSWIGPPVGSFEGD